MAKPSKKSPPRKSAKSDAASVDAIALLKADHRRVEDWFEEFEDSDDEAEKSRIAQQICSALMIHTAIEEEIFYPAFLVAVEDEDLHHEAIVEHEGAKRLIEQIEAGGPADEFYDARVKVLSEMIKHHVKEEEQPGGMFAEALKSDMDLEALGEQMSRRQQELGGGASDDETGGDEPSQRLMPKAGPSRKYGPGSSPVRTS